jgi:hypothetical protein
MPFCGVQGKTTVQTARPKVHQKRPEEFPILAA